MRLADFIRENHAAIVAEWETFAATLLSGVRRHDPRCASGSRTVATTGAAGICRRSG